MMVLNVKCRIFVLVLYGWAQVCLTNMLIQWTIKLCESVLFTAIQETNIRTNDYSSCAIFEYFTLGSYSRISINKFEFYFEILYVCRILHINTK